MVAPEDWIYRRELRLEIEREITNVVEKMIEAAKDHDLEFESHNSRDIKDDLNVVPRFFFPLKTWSLLIEDTRLPKIHRG